MSSPGTARPRSPVPAAVLLLCCVASASGARAASTGTVEPAGFPASVHPALAERLGAGGPVEFLVVLRRRARLDELRAVDDPLERRRRVVAMLRAAAERGQRPLLVELDRRGLDHRSFWIVDAVLVRGTAADVRAIAVRDDVLKVVANPRIDADLPRAEPARDSGAARAVEWNVSQIGAEQVWALGYTGQGVTIGGQDTGYQWDHPALRSAYRGWDGQAASHDHNWHDAIHSGGGVCGHETVAPCDDYDHGTHTMGTMVGDDGGSNRIGVAPGARWIGCRNMDQGDGTPATYMECFQWFLAPTALDGSDPDPVLAPQVINNSWSCPTSEGCDAGTLHDAVAAARAAGIVVVVSAGNAGPFCGSVNDPPAIYDESFSVAAVDSGDTIAGFSSRGPVSVDGSGRAKPDIAAPGVSVRSSIRNDGYATYQGTSMAGPHVAGAVALLLSARPDLTGRVDEIEALLRASAVPLMTTQACGADVPGAVPNNAYGAGRLDALALLTGDGDGDGSSNLDDCAPTDPQVWSTPGPVTDLRLEPLDGAPATRLSWSPPLAPGSTITRYDVLASPRPDFAVLDSLATGIVVAGFDDAAAAPAPGSIRHYLVRATDPCGVVAP